ncbi:hypothetical protein BHM03_00022169 [Ensete ventricosum]|nr:hypothetical protein BHM03_00022169 [Ensete ventricosum]
MPMPFPFQPPVALPPPPLAALLMLPLHPTATLIFQSSSLFPSIVVQVPFSLSAPSCPAAPLLVASLLLPPHTGRVSLDTLILLLPPPLTSSSSSPCRRCFPLPNHVTTSSIAAATPYCHCRTNTLPSSFPPPLLSSLPLLPALAFVDAFIARHLRCCQPPLPRRYHLPTSMPCHPFCNP